jgi:hypothetical protein
MHIENKNKRKVPNTDQIRYDENDQRKRCSASSTINSRENNVILFPFESKRNRRKDGGTTPN